MTEMPVHENPTFEDTIRALELAYSYFAVPGLVKNPVSLASYTERSAIAWAMNPPVGSVDEQLKNLCRGAIENLKVHGSKHPSELLGAFRLRMTLRHYCGMPPEKTRKPASERKSRPKHYQVSATYRADQTVFTLGYQFKSKAEAIRKARWLAKPGNVQRPVEVARVHAFFRDGRSEVVFERS